MRWILAAIFALTLAFNLRQELFGPAASGWRSVWPSLEVVEVVRGTPMERAGVRAGDVLEAADGRPLQGMADWLVARALFERDKPIEVQLRRGTQHLRARFVIERPSWQTWRTENVLAVGGFYFARLTLLSLAIFLAFSRPKHLSASLVALMFAVASVAEGYPSSGWAATLHHLPLILALPICLATSSWLLGAIAWLAFFVIFPRRSIRRRWQWGILLAPLIVFVPPLVTSAIAMIISPAALSPPSVPIARDLAGVAPLLYFNQAWIVELWLTITALYLIAGFVLLAVKARRRADWAMLISIVLFAVIAVHNFLARNWANWFGTATPALFSHASFAAEAVVFLIIPITLTYAVLFMDS